MAVRHDNNVLQHLVRDVNAIPPMNPANKLNWKEYLPGMSSVEIQGRTVRKVIKDGKTWIYGGDSRHNSFEIERQANGMLTVTVKNVNGVPLLEKVNYPDGRFSKKVVTAKGHVVERTKDASGTVTTSVRNADKGLVKKTVHYPNGDVRKTVKKLNEALVESFTNAATGTVTRAMKNPKAERLQKQMNSLVDKVKAQTEKTTLLYNRAENFLNTAKETLKKAKQTLKKKPAKQKSEGFFAKLREEFAKGSQFLETQIKAFVHRKLFGKVASKSKGVSTGAKVSTAELLGNVPATKAEVDKKTTLQSGQLQALVQALNPNQAFWTVPAAQTLKTLTTNSKKGQDKLKGRSLRRQ